MIKIHVQLSNCNENLLIKSGVVTILLKEKKNCYVYRVSIFYLFLKPYYLLHVMVTETQHNVYIKTTPEKGSPKMNFEIYKNMNTIINYKIHKHKIIYKLMCELCYSLYLNVQLTQHFYKGCGKYLIRK